MLPRNSCKKRPAHAAMPTIEGNPSSCKKALFVPISTQVRCNIIDTISRIDKVLSAVSKETGEIGRQSNELELTSDMLLPSELKSSQKDDKIVEKGFLEQGIKKTSLPLKGLQPSDSHEACGIIKFIPRLKAFYIKCFYCSCTFGLNSSAHFAKHMNSHHSEWNRMPRIKTEENNVEFSEKANTADIIGDKDIVQLIDIGEILNQSPPEANGAESRHNKENNRIHNQNTDSDEVILTKFEYDDDNECAEKEQVPETKNEVNEEIPCPQPSPGIGRYRMNVIDVDESPPAFVLGFLSILQMHPALYLDRKHGRSLYTYQAHAFLQDFEEQAHRDLHLENLQKSLVNLRRWYLNMTQEDLLDSNPIKKRYFSMMQQVEMLSQKIILRCDLCPNLFFTEENEMKLHKFRSHGIANLKFKCKYCYQLFETLKEKRKHHSTRHQKRNPFFCNMCIKTFATENLKKTHTVDHHSIKCYRCFCKSIFLTFELLREHQLKEHKALPPIAHPKQISTSKSVTSTAISDVCDGDISGKNGRIDPEAKAKPETPDETALNNILHIDIKMESDLEFIDTRQSSDRHNP